MDHRTSTRVPHTTLFRSLASTFLTFPLLRLVVVRLHLLDPTMAAGFLFLTLLPSTVQSSLAFTSIARGNIAAAVCSASFSNLLGIALTPLLASLLMRESGVTLSWGGARTKIGRAHV